MNWKYSLYCHHAANNAAIANQNLAIAQAWKFDHDHADEIAMCKVEGRQLSASLQLRVGPLLYGLDKLVAA